MLPECWRLHWPLSTSTELSALPFDARCATTDVDVCIAIWLMTTCIVTGVASSIARRIRAGDKVTMPVQDVPGEPSLDRSDKL